MANTLLQVQAQHNPATSSNTYGNRQHQHQPHTKTYIQGAGLFHIAMGAVLGIAAFGRTQEKLGGANNGGAAPASTGFPPPPAPAAQSGGFGNFAAPAAAPVAAPSGFGGGFSAPLPISTTASGKKIIPTDDPEI